MSIKDHGLLVAVSIRKPQLTAKDVKATADAEAANNAQGAGQYRKDLYPKHLIAPITECESRIRTYVRNMTLPWGENARLLPASKFMIFADTIGKLEIEFRQCVTVFLNNYTNVLQSARVQQGDLFDAGLYPDTTQLRSEFSFRVLYNPVADHNDFRVQMQAEDLAVIKAQAQEQAALDYSDLAAEAMSRLRATVAAMATTMAKPVRASINKKGGVDVKPPIFRDSVVDNIKDVADFLEAYAFALPPEVVGAANKAASELASVSAEALRQDDDLRVKHSAKATALLVEIDALLGVAPDVDELAPPPTEVILQMNEALLSDDMPVITSGQLSPETAEAVAEAHDAEPPAALQNLADSLNSMMEE